LVDTRARSSSDSEVVCGLVGVEWSVEQVPALWENRLARREEGGEEECRKAGRWSVGGSSDVVRAVVPSTRQGEENKTS
jgi:hypothetical protein